LAGSVTLSKTVVLFESFDSKIGVAGNCGFAEVPLARQNVFPYLPSLSEDSALMDLNEREFDQDM